MTTAQYETADIYLAAFLLFRGAMLLGCRRVGLRRNIFLFQSDEALHEQLRTFWTRAPVTLIPADLFGALRSLKSMVRLRPGAPRSSADGGMPTVPENGSSPDEPFGPGDGDDNSLCLP